MNRGKYRELAKKLRSMDSFEIVVMKGNERECVALLESSGRRLQFIA